MQLSNLLFKNIHSNNLIYNTCWEDPRCDRKLLELQPDSKMVMITSAGCNALDYALDKPAEINCVDMNPRQNALLDLKLAAIQNSDWTNLYAMFGEGKHHTAKDIYNDTLRCNLPEYSQTYWDKNINYFSGKGVRKSFYEHSTSGVFAWLFINYVKLNKTNRVLLNQMFDTENLEAQREIYLQLEKRIITNFMRRIMNSPLTMSMLGVPHSQQEMLYDDGKKTDTMGFIQKCLRHVFMDLSLSDNYFWQLYFRGKYENNVTPNYLKRENFQDLKQRTNTIKTHTTTITDFLKTNTGIYSHYVLLDHQDWLAANNRAALIEEWETILNNSRRGTRILLRSAQYNINFFPEFVKDRVFFEKEKTSLTHKQDRVGTYGSVYLGIVQ